MRCPGGYRDQGWTVSRSGLMQASVAVGVKGWTRRGGMGATAGALPQVRRGKTVFGEVAGERRPHSTIPSVRPGRPAPVDADPEPDGARRAPGAAGSRPQRDLGPGGHGRPPGNHGSRKARAADLGDPPDRRWNHLAVHRGFIRSSPRCIPANPRGPAVAMSRAPP